MKSAWVLVACLGCSAEQLPPLGHVMVFLDTDAPLRRSEGPPPAIDEPQPLFDGVSVDVFASGATEPCCSEDFELTEEQVRAGASFVVRLEGEGGAPRVRARMYRILLGVEAPPAPETVVEVVAELPAQPEEGATEVTLFLPTDAVGVPNGTLEAPSPVIPGRPAPSRVGTWPGAARRGCAEPPGPGEVCVPGGAFWMGHPLAPTLDPTSFTRPPPRLVVLSPFYLDAHEATVADLRATGEAPNYQWSGSRAGTSIFDWCTFTRQATAGFDNDNLPVNCNSWYRAQDYCLARGADLPSEAQLEYASGGLASRLYLWGLDEASCSDAVWGRCGGILAGYPADCLPAMDIGGPAPVGTQGARDRLELPTGVITDLAGNLHEWTLDAYQPLDGPCWVDRFVLTDPLCAEESSLRTVRGGSWGLAEAHLRATFRFAENLPTATVGFRCARHAEPAP
ncbi:MAG TPA: SUMF1/EgtB/PvdO family nonheme iron enzyme [Polyangiaceae bacterium]|nr:SUMF1/EgtB/PvdO family nonheme iron enzyme [Polyangiaceae bacterium]